MKTISHFTLTAISILISMTLPLSACIVSGEQYGEGAESADLEVINTNEAIEGGFLHTFESEDVFASVEVIASDDGLHMTYFVENSTESYQASMYYTVLEDGQFVLEDPATAAADSEELARLLAGTAVEEYLKSDALDLTAGIDQEGEHFRAAACWGWKAAMISACGATYAAAIVLGFFTGGLGAAGVVVVGSPACVYAAGKWMLCESANN